MPFDNASNVSHGGNGTPSNSNYSQDFEHRTFAESEMSTKLLGFWVLLSAFTVSTDTKYFQRSANREGDISPMVSTENNNYC